MRKALDFEVSQNPLFLLYSYPFSLGSLVRLTPVTGDSRDRARRRWFVKVFMEKAVRSGPAGEALANLAVPNKQPQEVYLHKST